MHKQAERCKARLEARPLYLLSIDPVCEPCGGKVKGAKKVSTRIAYNLGFDKEKQEFDYVKEDDQGSPSFFRYKGQAYYLGNFMRTGALKGWDGAEHHSMCAGICVRYTKDLEGIIVGHFWS